MASDNGRWLRVYAGTDDEAYELTNFVGDVTLSESPDAESETLYNQSYQEVIPTLTEVGVSIDFIHRGDTTQNIDRWLRNGTQPYWAFVWSSKAAPFATGAVDYAVWGEWSITSHTVTARQGVNRTTVALSQSNDVFHSKGFITEFEFKTGSGNQSIAISPAAVATDRIDVFVLRNTRSSGATNIRIVNDRILNVGANKTAHGGLTGEAGATLNTNTTLGAGDIVSGIALVGQKVESA